MVTNEDGVRRACELVELDETRGREFDTGHREARKGARLNGRVGRCYVFFVCITCSQAMLHPLAIAKPRRTKSPSVRRPLMLTML